MPASLEEERFVRAFANALVHATAVAAADPETPLPEGSLAERVRLAYGRFRPEEHRVIGDRARSRLSASPEERRRIFGDYADWTPETARALDDDLKAKLKPAVRARLAPHRHAFQELLSNGGISSGMAAWAKPKTSLEAGYFTGDVQANWKEMTISSPATVEFLWKTEEPEAERGVWQLFRVDPGHKEILLATGDAGDAPGPQLFVLDLSHYLPGAAPAVPTVYHVRVSPQTKMKLQPSAFQGLGGAKIPGKAVGPASEPVIITYSAISSPEYLGEVWQLYRVLTLGPTKLHMVEDQFGPGAEEFWVAGFVQEFVPSGSSHTGKQVKFGPKYAVLDPDGPRWADIAVPVDFWLDNPDTEDWPRVYAIVVSALEEDDGGSFNDWHAELADLANQFLVGDVASQIEDYLQQEFQDFISENWDLILEQAPTVAEEIVAAAGSTSAGIIGAVIAVAAFVIAAIVSDAGDDFYGVQASTIPLPTNIRQYVESLPGHESSEGFKLDQDPFTLLGTPSVLQAQSYDGKVEVYFDCHLSDVVTY